MASGVVFAGGAAPATLRFRGREVLNASQIIPMPIRKSITAHVQTSTGAAAPRAAKFAAFIAARTATNPQKARM
jgi:hypothetical protein